MATADQRYALTICIPTYNRGKRVHALVLYLKRNLLPFTDQVEIVVVNNCSKDETQQLIEPLAGDRVRLINRTEFLPTAEENMFESLEFCNGEFVWFHGDDEVPVCDTILDLVDLIRADTADLFIFNSRLIDGDGALLAEFMVPMNGDHFDATGDEFVRAVGFMFMLAGISNVIFRRRFAEVSLAREALAVQKIYSHVCWLLECFNQRRTRIVNRPLVFYRHAGDTQQFDHFRNFAKRHGIGDFYFWGIGVTRQLQYLVSKGVLKPSVIPQIFEGRRDGTRFKFLHECIHKVFKQVEAAVLTGEPRNQVAPDVFRSVRDFLVSCDLFAYDLFEPIERIQEIAEGKRPRGELRKWTRLFHRTYAEHDRDIYRDCKRFNRSGFDIYQMPCGWVAVDPAVPGGVAAVLAVLDIAEARPHVWVDTDLNRLVANITEYRMSLAANDAFRQGSQAELLSLGREFLGVSHAILGQYATRVEISRQTTAPVRVVSNLIVNPIRRARNVVRRAVGRLTNA
ncbi:glycosyltransferase [Trinickia caryophylli]|uniref:Glycosyltransferase involved in cell wall bisynthesis n=1 Tax=Trinickia caryophylli TaxID=28094 RepID=A0A1X7CCK4_TRICW|nr:glycosyltransferase [Trinickia caryophylli]PMS12500.1 glycosyltransferase family 2 protein [Trinickia caryophylli]TRX19703.1 glycosyltransferase family 2 protein [Trinickia caryophylli]WQE12984.1 glycosyltransferase [Trinickia caryophylli]SME93993.1 Glycosyltransferase involved in cell wall bisynthesis [Trinickia caryophylli]GLU30714.1 hypothetical protein Busp01_05560 [Trinickia caryophylli]